MRLRSDRAGRKSGLLNSYWRVVISCIFVCGCSPKKEVKPEAELTPAEKLEKLVRHGRVVYVSHCTACHSPNPQKDGALGPAVWGSSLELLEARLLRAQYPPGYKPKRPSGMMQAMPHLKNEIPSLHAYLNSSTP